LAQIARQDIGKLAGAAAATAILFILIIALAGLGKVVVMALGGDEVHYPVGSKLVVSSIQERPAHEGEPHFYEIGPGSMLVWNKGKNTTTFQESFTLRSAAALAADKGEISLTAPNPAKPKESEAVRVTPGSTWG